MKPPEVALEVRLRAMGVLFVVIGLIAVVQLTSFAPFPHRIDSFVGGLATGIGMTLVLGWIILRRSRAKSDPTREA